jgi:hypothetical protein
MKPFKYNFIINQSFAIHEMEKSNIVQIAALTFYFILQSWLTQLLCIYQKDNYCQVANIFGNCEKVLARHESRKVKTLKYPKSQLIVTASFTTLIIF